MVAGVQVPVIPLSEVGGRFGTPSPWQMLSAVPKLKVGTRLEVTVTVRLVGFAHWPAVGVNVYVPEFILSMMAGLHVPVIPLTEVPGSAGGADPSQIVMLVPREKVGVTIGLTVTVKVVVTAHRPLVGVNVYVPEFILSTTEGLQLPVIPLSELPGKPGTVPPLQIDRVVPKLKVGVIFGLTVTEKLVAVAHCPAPGVKV